MIKTYDGPHGASPAKGFHHWARGRAILAQARAGLVSLSGAFAAAIALGLAAELSPDNPDADVLERAVHAVLVVAATLCALALLEACQRLALYTWRSRRWWKITWADHGRLLGFAIDQRREQPRLPDSIRIAILTPTGQFYAQGAVNHAMDIVNGEYPSGAWVHLVEQPYEEGNYEVRAYEAATGRELVRARVSVKAA